MAERILGDRYQIENQIGEGGMAYVYVANDTKLNRKVAIKVLHKHMLKNKDVRERFEKEAQAVSQLEHPNIIKIYDFSGANSKQLWIVMELIDGWNLAEFVDQFPARSLHPIVATSITREVCKALAKAHGAGLVHRDIKPENIMIMKDGRIKLMDFGIVKDVSKANVTQTGTFMGSPSYMSPEQIRGKNVDLRSDLYSLCILYYEICTGKLPFNGNTTHDVVLKIVQGDYAAPRFLVPSIPATIDSIIVGGIQKSPGNRYQSVEEISQRIDQFMEAHGFVETHVELERFFQNRKNYLQHLAESDFGRGVTNSAEKVKAVSGSFYSATTRNAGGAPLRINETIKTDSHIVKNNRNSSTRILSNNDLSFDDVMNSIEKESVAPVLPKNNSAQKNQNHKSRNQGQSRQHQIQRQRQLGQKQKRRNQVVIDYKNTKQESNWLDQLLGIIIVGAIIGISAFGFWQIKQKIDKKRSNQTNFSNLKRPLDPSRSFLSHGKRKSRQKIGVSEDSVLGETPVSIARKNIDNKTSRTRKKTGTSIRKTKSSQKTITPIRKPREYQPNQRKITARIPKPYTGRNTAKKNPVVKTTGKQSKSAIAAEAALTARADLEETAPPAPSEFQIVSRPASIVFIDGKKVGTTNRRRNDSGWIEVRPGRRKIELKRENYVTYSKTIAIRAGEQIKLPTIRLRQSTLIPFEIKSRQTGVYIQITDLGTKKRLPSFIMSNPSRSLSLRAGTYKIRVEYGDKMTEKIIELKEKSEKMIFDIRKL